MSKIEAVAVTQMQHLSFDACAKHTVAVAAGHQKATYLLVSSLTVAMLANAYPQAYQNDKGETITPKPIGWDETITQLKASLVPTGLKNAMIYRYIAISKKLGLKLIQTEGKFGGDVARVLSSRTPKAAMDIVHDYIVRQIGEKGTIDDLMAYTTMAQRTGTETGEAKGPTVKASTSSPESIAARIAKEPTVLASVKPEVLLGAMGQQDDTQRVRFLDKAIDTLTTPDALKHIMDYARARLEAMAKGTEQPRGRNGKNVGERVPQSPVPEAAVA